MKLKKLQKQNCPSMGRLKLERTSTKPLKYYQYVGDIWLKNSPEYIKAKAGLNVLCGCCSCDFRQWQALTQFVDNVDCLWKICCLSVHWNFFKTLF